MDRKGDNSPAALIYATVLLMWSFKFSLVRSRAQSSVLFFLYLPSSFYTFSDPHNYIFPDEHLHPSLGRKTMLIPHIFGRSVVSILLLSPSFTFAQVLKSYEPKLTGDEAYGCRADGRGVIKQSLSYGACRLRPRPTSVAVTLTENAAVVTCIEFPGMDKCFLPTPPSSSHPDESLESLDTTYVSSTAKPSQRSRVTVSALATSKPSTTSEVLASNTGKSSPQSIHNQQAGQPTGARPSREGQNRDAALSAQLAKDTTGGVVDGKTDTGAPNSHAGNKTTPASGATTTADLDPQLLDIIRGHINATYQRGGASTAKTPTQLGHLSQASASPGAKNQSATAHPPGEVYRGNFTWSRSGKFGSGDASDSSNASNAGEDDLAEIAGEGPESFDGLEDDRDMAQDIAHHSSHSGNYSLDDPLGELGGLAGFDLGEGSDPADEHEGSGKNPASAESGDPADFYGPAGGVLGDGSISKGDDAADPKGKGKAKDPSQISQNEPQQPEGQVRRPQVQFQDLPTPDRKGKGKGKKPSNYPKGRPKAKEPGQVSQNAPQQPGESSQRPQEQVQDVQAKPDPKLHKPQPQGSHDTASRPGKNGKEIAKILNNLPTDAIWRPGRWTQQLSQSWRFQVVTMDWLGRIGQLPGVYYPLRFAVNEWLRGIPVPEHGSIPIPPGGWAVPPGKAWPLNPPAQRPAPPTSPGTSSGTSSGGDPTEDIPEDPRWPGDADFPDTYRWKQRPGQKPQPKLSDVLKWKQDRDKDVWKDKKKVKFGDTLQIWADTQEWLDRIPLPEGWDGPIPKYEVPRPPTPHPDEISEPADPRYEAWVKPGPPPGQPRIIEPGYVAPPEGPIPAADGPGAPRPEFLPQGPIPPPGKLPQFIGWRFVPPKCIFAPYMSVLGITIGLGVGLTVRQMKDNPHDSELPYSVLPDAPVALTSQPNGTTAAADGYTESLLWADPTAVAVVTVTPSPSDPQSGVSTSVDMDIDPLALWKTFLPLSTVLAVTSGSISTTEELRPLQTEDSIYGVVSGEPGPQALGSILPVPSSWSPMTATAVADASFTTRGSASVHSLVYDFPTGTGLMTAGPSGGPLSSAYFAPSVPFSSVVGPIPSIFAAEGGSPLATHKTLASLSMPASPLSSLAPVAPLLAHSPASVYTPSSFLSLPSAKSWSTVARASSAPIATTATKGFKNTTKSGAIKFSPLPISPLPIASYKDYPAVGNATWSWPAANSSLVHSRKTMTPSRLGSLGDTAGTTETAPGRSTVYYDPIVYTPPAFVPIGPQEHPTTATGESYTVITETIKVLKTVWYGLPSSISSQRNSSSLAPVTKTAPVPLTASEFFLEKIRGRPFTTTLQIRARDLLARCNPAQSLRSPGAERTAKLRRSNQRHQPPAPVPKARRCFSIQRCC